MDDLRQPEEEQLNRLLRRADWRYLLSNPRPGKSICFTDGLLKEAVGAISSQMVPPEAAKAGEFDLAAAVDPSEVVLRSAWEALGPGGDIYTEWYRPWIGGARGVRRRLEKAGFKEITCYWAWPPPRSASPLYWLPLHSPRLIDYYFDSRPQSPALFVKLARSMLQILSRLGLHQYFFVPVCAVARKPAADLYDGFRESINMEIVKQCKKRGWREIPSELTWLLWTPGHRLISKIVAMVFTEDQAAPALVVKIPRSGTAAQALETEKRNLEILSYRKPTLKGTPALLFELDWKGIQTIGESFVTGVPIYTVLGPENYRELAFKVTGWLIELAAGSAPAARPEWWDRLVGLVLDDFGGSFGRVFTSRELSSLRTALDMLGGLPLVIEQRDCSPWNILIDKMGEIKVLDWESAEMNGLPALDLIYFLTYLSFFADGAMESKDFLTAYRSSLDPGSFTGKINKECQDHYCSRINLDPALLSSLRLLTWLVHSRHEYRRLREDAGGDPSEAALQAGLFSRLIREEIRLHQGT